MKRLLPMSILMLSLVLGPKIVNASSARQVSVDELVQNADLVVLGTALSSESFWDKGLIQTRIKVHVEETWVGTQHTGDIDVVIPGGVIGTIGQRVDGAPHISIGTRAIFCLTKVQNNLRAVALGQGIFFVRAWSDAVADQVVEQAVAGLYFAGPRIFSLPTTLHSLKQAVLNVPREAKRAR